MTDFGLSELGKVLNLQSFDQDIDNVKIDHALTFGMPKKVFS